MFRVFRLTRHLHQAPLIITPTVGATRARAPRFRAKSKHHRAMSSELKAEHAAGTPAAAPAVSAAVLASFNARKEARLKALHHDDGWLTLCGLDWLEVGDNAVGSGEKNTVKLPECCPASTAIITRAADDSLRLVPAPGVALVAGGAAVAPGGVEIKSDAKGPATVVVVPNHDGTPSRVSFFVVKRDTKIGVRMKDKKNPVFVNFTGLDHFPPADEWKVAATYRPHPGGVKILPTVNMYGLNDPQKSPGVLEFAHGGKLYTLDVVEEDGEADRFFILFKDQTCGKESYGMRYMYCPRPPAGSDQTFIDFNHAYSPPCCFTPFATCAIPPKQNWLPFRVTAGEKMYGAHH